MTCDACGEKPKKTNKGFPKAVVEINNPETLVLLRKVVIPASMGDETAFPPAIGKYFNVLLHYEASGSNYLYSSDGIPTEIGANIPPEVLDRIKTLEDNYDDLAEDYEQLQSDVGDLSEDLSAETSARELADGNLQTQIDAITASSDVKDIVGTKAELNNYDTSTLGNNDIIKVLQDESENNATTYYRWNATTQQFTLIGEEGPYYTKAATDTLLNAKQDVLTAGEGIDITNNVISAIGGGGSSEVIKLSTDDYNWNHTTKTTTGTLDTVAVWLLQPGIYELSEDMYLSTNRDSYQSFRAKSMFIALPDAFAGPYTIRTVFVTNGTDIVKDTPTTRNGETFIDRGKMLSETQMGWAKQLTSSLYNDWIDSSSTEYDCINVSRLAPGVYYSPFSNVYIREYYQGPVVTGMDRVYIVSGNSGGGVNPKHILKMTPDGISYISLTGEGTFVSETPVLLSSSIVQTTGTSTSDIMSQNAVTDAINNAGFVRNTDYATNAVGGVVKTNTNYGTSIDSNGSLRGTTKTYEDYGSMHNLGLISKVTLENVITGKGLVDQTALAGKQDTLTAGTGIDITNNVISATGGGGPTVVQTTGTSTTDVMSQNAVTSMVFGDAGTNNKIVIGTGASVSAQSYNMAIGTSASADGTQSTAVGYSAKARPNGVALGYKAQAGVTATHANTVAIGQSTYGYGDHGVAVGDSSNILNSYSTAIGSNARARSERSVAIGASAEVANSPAMAYSVALGANSITTRAGEVNIGTGANNFGYNSTPYRVIGGVHDGQELHDAATVAQGNTLATSAPTTSTVGVLGQLYTDTTNMHTYQCTAISGDTYTWTQRW